MKKLSLLLVIVLLLSACAPAGNDSDADGPKIISLAPSLTEIVYALDLQDHLVGRTDNDNYPEQVASLESIGSGFEPDIEKIISLAPDTVLYVFDNPELAAKLEEAGIKAIQYAQVNTVEEIYGLIETIGADFDRADKAKQVVDGMKAKIDQVAQAVAGAEPVSVYYAVGFGPEGDFTATGDTFIHDMLTIAGGDNIAKDATGWSYNLESLLAADPEIILTSDQWDMKAGFIAADGYDKLTAVQQDKVYEINPDLLDRQGPRIADGIEALAKLLHPDLVK